METPRHWRERKNRLGTGEGGLLGTKCPACHSPIFPANRPVCPHCGHGGSVSIVESLREVSTEKSVEVKKGFGVAVVIIDQSSGDILLSTIFNLEDEGKFEGSASNALKPVTQIYSLLAGGVKEDEGVREAVAREAREEAEIVVFPSDLISLGEFPNNIFQSRLEKNVVFNFDGEVFILEVDAESIEKNSDWQFFTQENIRLMIEKELLRYPSAAILQKYFSDLVKYLPEQAIVAINSLASVQVSA